MTIQTDRTRRPFALTDAVAFLARTPVVFDGLLRGLPDDWTSAHEGGDTWSPLDVIAHLIHGEQTDWMPRVAMVLDHGESRTFDPYDRVAQFAISKGRTLTSLLDEFAALRVENLRRLAAMNLTETDLDRCGRHPEFGPVTLRQLLATWVAHDFDHIMQIARVFGRQYSDEVGPWRAYLRVVSGAQG